MGHHEVIRLILKDERVNPADEVLKEALQDSEQLDYVHYDEIAKLHLNM